MNAKARTARQIVKARRSANTKRCISTYVARVTGDEAVRKAVTNALRTNAKKLREAGELGKVQTRTCHVTTGVVGKKYRYTAEQLRRIAAAYKPRKAEYKAVKAELV